MGFGICHLLLVQLSSHYLSDAQAYFKVPREKAWGLEFPDWSPDAGVRIVVVCCDTKRAQDVREKIYGMLYIHIATLRQGTEDHAYAVALRRSMRQDKSVLDFGKA